MPSRPTAGIVGVLILFALTGQAWAQTPAIRDPLAGDCRIIIQLPDRAATVVQVSVNGKALLLTPIARLNETAFVLPLVGPLQQGDRVDANISSGVTVTAPVGPGISGDIACGGLAALQNHADDREDFEASGFLGLAVDNFAPKKAGGYSDSATDIRTRKTFGFVAEYRLLGQKGGQLQFWISGATLNGVRTADIDCASADQAALCKNSTPNVSLGAPSNIQVVGAEIIQHATSLEAHIDSRLELLAFQRKSTTPLKLFAYARFGFVDLAQEPRPFSTDQIGIGATVPAGPFRHSSFTWGWGKNLLFGTNQGNSGWNRSMINTLLVFDVAPGLSDFSVGKWLGFGAWRIFADLSIDRNPGGPGPDSVQSYLGVSFDLRKAFHP